VIVHMKTIPVGKLRGLQQCTSPQGSFTCLALDHRQNLRRALSPQEPGRVTDAELSGFKLEVTACLAGSATAVLLDPEVSAAQAIATGSLPGQVGLVVALESTGYGGAPTARQSQLLPGWSVEKAKRMGASMAKLLVYYHPKSPAAAEIEDFVGLTSQECSRYDIGLMLEPLSYPLQEGTKLSSAEKRFVVTESARRLVAPGVDVLKAEFPLDVRAAEDEKTWAEACAEISAASPVPWILLSAAVDYESYLRQVLVACQAGASGIAVGRAVWQEAVGLEGPARTAFLRTTAQARLAQLTELCSRNARPIQSFYSAEAPFDWYKNY
jgi:tagatose 1,6-diphosphate aldolase